MRGWAAGRKKRPAALLRHRRYPQAELLVDADLRGMADADFQHCAAALLARAATATVGRSGRPLSAAPLAAVACRCVGRARIAASVAASATMLLLALLLSVRLSAAFLTLAGGPTLSAIAGRGSPALRKHGAVPGPVGLAKAAAGVCSPGTSHRRLAAGGGPVMCNPVPTPVDPTLAAVLLSLGFSRAAEGLRRLGDLSPAAVGVKTASGAGSAGISLPPVDGLVSLQAVGRRPLSWLREAAAEPAKATRGTATLIRSAATEAVGFALRGGPASESVSVCRDFCGPACLHCWPRESFF